MAIDPDYLDAVLDPLAQLFRAAAGGDTEAARLVAERAVAAHLPETDDELVIAAQAVALGIRSLQFLGQSAGADVAPEKAVRLCGSAVTMGRESLRMRGVLQDMQAARAAAPPDAPPPRAQEPPEAPQAIDLTAPARTVQATHGKVAARRMTKQDMLRRMAENASRAREGCERAQRAAAPA